MSMCIQMYGRNADFVCSFIFEVCKYGMWFWYYIVDLYDFVCMVAVFFILLIFPHICCSCGRSKQMDQFKQR